MALAFLQVQGDDNLVSLLQALKPSTLIPLLNAEFPMEGPLSGLIREVGRPEDVEAKLQKAGVKDVRVQFPAPPGEPVSFQL